MTTQALPKTVTIRRLSRAAKTAYLDGARATGSLGLQPRLDAGPSTQHLAASALLTLSQADRDAYERVRRLVSPRHAALLAGLLVSDRLREADMSPRGRTLLAHLDTLAGCRLHRKLDRVMLLNQALRVISGLSQDLREEFHQERALITRAEVLATIACHARQPGRSAGNVSLNASEFVRVLVDLLSPGVMHPPRPIARKAEPAPRSLGWLRHLIGA